MPQIQRRFLARSRWTARTPLADSAGECHFEVTSIAREMVMLRASVTGRCYRVAIAALDDTDAWSPGWLSLA